MTNTVDPLGGSWFVESLTNEVERQVWHYLDEIDALGGMVKAIAAGFPQKEIADAAYRFQREFDEGEREIVGVNVYADPDEELTIPLLEVSEESKQQPPRAAGADARRARSGSASRRRSPGCATCRRGPARSEANVMPALIECANAYATLGEMCGVFRAVFGEYREPVAV